MTVRERFDFFVSKINKINEVLMVLAILVMFVVLLAQIGTRFVFFVPLPASQDIIMYFLVASVFMGVGTAVASGKMIAIDIVPLCLPEKGRNVLLFAADLASLVFSCVLIRQGIFMMGKTKGTILGASPFTVNLYYLLIVIGCCVMALNYFNNLLKRVSSPGKSGGE